MSAPEGNQFWKARSSHGRKPIFETPDDLWDACVQYFEWVETNPLKSSELVSYQGKSVLEEVPKMRAMTIDGLCIFLDIGFQTWKDYCSRQDYSEVTTRAEKIIRTQKFEGAAGGFLNPNIIARDLGLAERTEHSGPDGGPIQMKDSFDRESARRLAFALTEAARGPGGAGEKGD